MGTIKHIIKYTTVEQEQCRVQHYEELQMAKTAAKNPQKKISTGWSYHATNQKDYEIFVDDSEKHSGKRCATLRSIVAQPKPFGNLMQYMSAVKYAGQRLRIAAWVKAKIEEGRSQRWLRIDGDWKSVSQEGCFDNMDDRPIEAKTDWTKYEPVVQRPEKSTGIAFGLMLIGKGQVWLDDVSFEGVSQDVPLTGSFINGKSRGPINLDFEDE